MAAAATTTTTTATATATATPSPGTISSESYPLPLTTQHSSLPPLYVQITHLRQSVIVSLGSPTASTSSFALMNDFSVALPPMTYSRSSTSTSTATALSRSTPQSLLLSNKLAKRYRTQVYLSLDLRSFSAAANASSLNGEWDPVLWFEVEKGLINVLDKVLDRDAVRG